MIRLMSVENIIDKSMKRSINKIKKIVASNQKAKTFGGHLMKKEGLEI